MDDDDDDDDDTYLGEMSKIGDIEIGGEREEQE